MASDPSENVRAFDYSVLDRMVEVGAKTRERIRRCTQALEVANIPYAIASDHAVAEWVRDVDESAVRNAVDIVIVIRRGDFDATQQQLLQLGFVSAPNEYGKVCYSDPDGSKFHHDLELIFAGEKRRPEHLFPIPDVSESRRGRAYRVLELRPLVMMGLTGRRSLDYVHVRDLIDVGLVDSGWLDGLPFELAVKLKELLDNPDG